MLTIFLTRSPLFPFYTVKKVKTTLISFALLHEVRVIGRMTDYKRVYASDEIVNKCDPHFVHL